MLSLGWDCAGKFSLRNMVSHMESWANIWLRGCNMTVKRYTASHSIVDYRAMIKWSITALTIQIW